MKARCQHSRETVSNALWSKDFVLLVLISFGVFTIGQGVNSGSSMLLDLVGEPATYSGVLALVFSLTAGVARLVAGPFLDKTSKVRTLAFGAAMLLFSIALPLVLNDFGLPYLFCRILQGVGFGVGTTACSAAAAEILPGKRLGEGIGYLGLGQAVALSVGPAFAMFLLLLGGPWAMFLGLTACAILTMVLVLCCRYEKLPEKLPETSAFRLAWESRRASLNRGAESAQSIVERQGAKPFGESSKNIKGGLAGILAAVFEVRAIPGALPMLFLSLSFGFATFFSGLYGLRIGVENPSVFFVLASIAMLLTRLFAGSYMDTVSPRVLFAVVGASATIEVILFQAALCGPTFFYVAGFFYGIASGIGTPLCQSVCIKNSPPERWGAASSLFLLALDIGVGVGSALWGYLGDVYGFGSALWLIEICIVLSVVVAWICFPKGKKS